MKRRQNAFFVCRPDECDRFRHIADVIYRHAPALARRVRDGVLDVEKEVVDARINWGRIYIVTLDGDALGYCAQVPGETVIESIAYIEFIAYAGGDMQCFCFGVDAETFHRLTGREPEDDDKGFPGDQPDDLYLVYPNVLFKSGKTHHIRVSVRELPDNG